MSFLSRFTLSSPELGAERIEGSAAIAVGPFDMRGCRPATQGENGWSGGAVASLLRVKMVETAVMPVIASQARVPASAGTGQKSTTHTRPNRPGPASTGMGQDHVSLQVGAIYSAATASRAGYLTAPLAFMAAISASE